MCLPPILVLLRQPQGEVRSRRFMAKMSDLDPCHLQVFGLAFVAAVLNPRQPIIASLKMLKSNVALAHQVKQVFVHCLFCVSFDFPNGFWLFFGIAADLSPLQTKEQQRRNQNKWSSVGDAMDKAGRSQHIRWPKALY